MSSCSTLANGKQRRPKSPRFFSITFRIEGTSYGVVPLRDVAPDVAVKAYRFLRKDEKGAVTARYDVRQLPEGGASCECKGFLRWGHCKHVETLTAAGMIQLEGGSHE
jgi:hypothetical protein